MPQFATDDHGVAWRLDRYLDEGPRSTDWLAPGVIQHRTVDHPEWAVEVERPPFLLVAARRPT